MSRALNILKSLSEDDAYSPIDTDTVKSRLEDKISSLGVKGILIDDVSADTQGNIFVDLSDTEGNQISISFGYDEDGASAMIIYPDDSDTIIVDLDSLAPSVLNTPFGTYLNMLELSWLNKSTLLTILTAGDVGTDANITPAALTYDAFGNVMQNPAESLTEKNSVSRGGKKVRLPIVASKHKTKLSLRQHSANSHKESSGKKRAKYLKITK